MLIACSLQELARERGEKPVEGEVFKWLGHAHSKMGETQQAEGLFKQGEQEGGLAERDVCSSG